ncbi:sterigmatocystin biosynthesis monooxygenase stcW [Fusarium sp. NRRL 52700]|nr:sterigmatocystin biosynthesis monooxygenase stcW [Fusarium sp. NRRL 52700]
MTVSNGNNYATTFDNRIGGTPITRDDEAPYKVSEHILCAPRKLRVGCIGAGASGIMICYKKKKEFDEDIDLVVYERYPKPGGVWSANKYSGCHCDRTFEDRVDFLIANIGILNTWKWPDIPNREAFRGHITHSADYDTNLDLQGKTVIVIGSCASAIQIVPAIKPIAKKAISFYRTPQWIGPGLPMDSYTDSEGRNFLYTDEQKKLFAEDPKAYLEHRKAMETKINASFPHNIADHPNQKTAREFVAKRMANILKNDEKLTRHLIPTFPMGCRRLGPAEGFLGSFHEDNVELAEGEIESFTENGLRVDDGTEYQADVIICATAFNVSFKAHFPVIGRDDH